MPDASNMSPWEHRALARIDALRRRADEHRQLARGINQRGGWSWGEWLFSATNFDSQADIIAENLKAGKPLPEVDFGNEPFKG